MTYDRRPATAEDYDFLWRLHVATMKEYVERTWGWDEAFQEVFFRERFDPTLSEILLVETDEVGVLSVEMREMEMFLSNIQVLPEYQGHGIGTAVLRDVLAEAGRRGVPVALQVLKVNRRARELYQRLGFAVAGENETHYRMRRG